MITIDDAVNNFVDYIDHAYQGQLYYEMTRNFAPFCGPLRKPDSETVGVSIAISMKDDEVTYGDPYSSLGIQYLSVSQQQYFEVVIIFENGWSSREVKFAFDGSDRLTEFLSVFACFICLNDERLLAGDEIFALLPDKVDLSYIIRAIDIDHNVELLSRMIEDIYHYCGDRSYEKHIRAMLDYFTSTEHNNPELTAVILNKMHKLGIPDEGAVFYI